MYIDWFFSFQYIRHHHSFHYFVSLCLNFMEHNKTFFFFTFVLKISHYTWTASWWSYIKSVKNHFTTLTFVNSAVTNPNWMTEYIRRGTKRINLMSPKNNIRDDNCVFNFWRGLTDDMKRRSFKGSSKKTAIRSEIRMQPI